MFCVKCGHENLDDAGFCTQCGTSFTSEEFLGEKQNVTVAMTKKEYFASHCSASAKRKRKAIQILSIASLAIQGVFAVLVVISLSALSYAIEQSQLNEGSASGIFILPIAFALVFTGGSFVFTILGLKKNSTGFFVTATIFAFLSAAYGSINFGSLPLRQLIAFGTLAMYIVNVVLILQSNKEYKEYTCQYITTKKGHKKYVPLCFTTNKQGGLKKLLVLLIGVVLLCAFTSFALSSYGVKGCHNCGDPVGSDPVKAGGRTYCSYDCYMDEVLFD